jgi:hypothetical protein
MKPLFFNLIFFISVLPAIAQKAEYFEFLLLPQNLNYSVFHKVEFADNRLNQDYIGITRRKSDNKLAPLWPHTSLPGEIKTLIDSAIKNVPKEPYTVLINIRNFFINENTGRFEFYVECYAKWDNEYWLVYHIDTAYKAGGSGINRKVNEVVSDFIAAIVHLDLSKNQKIKPRSFDYISNIDANEKKEIPIFNVRRPEKGVYYSYDEFKNNKPRLTIFNTVMRRNELKSVLRLPIGNKLVKKIPRDSLYAVSDGENVWIAAPHEYARLNKRGLDFFFRATAYENNKIEEISLSFVFFGIPGAALAAIPRKAMYEFRLNHLNGKYILLRRASDR